MCLWSSRFAVARWKKRCETQGKSCRGKPIAKDLEPITPDQIRIIVMSANVAEKIAMNDKCVNHNGITSFSS